MPENVVTEGRQYREPSHVRTFDLPAAGHTVFFSYKRVGGANGSEPEENETGGVYELEEAEPAAAEASESESFLESKPLPFAMREIMKNEFENEFRACVADSYYPVLRGNRAEPTVRSSWWMSCKPTGLEYLELMATLEEAPILVKREEEWLPRDALGGGLGVAAYTPNVQWPLGSGPHRLSANCRNIDGLHYWRNAGTLFGFSTRFPKGIVLEAKYFPGKGYWCT